MQRETTSCSTTWGRQRKWRQHECHHFNNLTGLCARLVILEENQISRTPPLQSHQSPPSGVAEVLEKKSRIIQMTAATMFTSNLSHFFAWNPQQIRSFATHVQPEPRLQRLQQSKTATLVRNRLVKDRHSSQRPRRNEKVARFAFKMTKSFDRRHPMEDFPAIAAPKWFRFTGSRADPASRTRILFVKQYKRHFRAAI